MLRMVSYLRRPLSGHITCYLNRTYHVLPTHHNCSLDTAHFSPYPARESASFIIEFRDGRISKGAHVYFHLSGFSWLGGGLGCGQDHEGFGLWTGDGLSPRRDRFHRRHLDHENFRALQYRRTRSQHIGGDLRRSCRGSVGSLIEKSLAHQPNPIKHSRQDFYHSCYHAVLTIVSDV